MLSYMCSANVNLQLSISLVECILLRITVSVGDEPILSRSYVRVVISVTVSDVLHSVSDSYLTLAIYTNDVHVTFSFLK